MRYCIIKECNRKYSAKGYCASHYFSWKKYGKLSMRTYEQHGMHKSPEYNAWKHMKERCNNKNRKEYANYGGRGIKVCDEWSKFTNFYRDMGKRPSKKHSLDRIDNDGDYTPENCRWVTNDMQQSNKRVRNNTGYRGVYKIKNKYYAKITVDYKSIWLGSSYDLMEAVKIREDAVNHYRHND